MKVSQVIKKLEKILCEYGDIDFGVVHYPTICRVEHDSFVPPLNIYVVDFRCNPVSPETRGYKAAVAK